MATLSMKFFSPALQTKTNVNILIPTPESTLAGHQETFAECAKTGPFPVLYLLHGTFGDESDWTRFSRIEDYARKYNIVVVMPNCENSCYRDTPAAKNYYTYVTEELPAMIGWMLPVSQKREDTFIAGLSMGGSGAFMLGMSRPDLYGYVACLSGGFGNTGIRQRKKGSPWAWAFEPGEVTEGTRDDPRWLAKHVLETAEQVPALYMCCGTEDFLYEGNCELRDYLTQIGMQLTYHEQPGVHDWNFWDDEIKRIFQWLPITRKGEGKYT